MSLKIILPCLMGLESVLASELRELGYDSEAIEKQNASVTLSCGNSKENISSALARCNIFLRTAERVLLEVSSFRAESFDELFENVRNLDWSSWISKGESFSVKGFSRKSKLFAPSAIQSITKKAIVRSLQKSWGMGENSEIDEGQGEISHQIHYSVMDETVSLSFDTSGEGLHKRGYRKLHNFAPIKETLAAGIILLSKPDFSGREIFFDPCAGSGTLPIEAAMIASNRAPGKEREFRAEKWEFLRKDAFSEAREEAKAAENMDILNELVILGSDIDRTSVKIAAKNAEAAGLGGCVSFYCADLREFRAEELIEKYGKEALLLVSNPPYGERLSDKKTASSLNRILGEKIFDEGGRFTKAGMRLSVISASDFEKDCGRRADKRRKLYNGMIPCTLYQYFRQVWS